eukprot:490640_1
MVTIYHLSMLLFLICPQNGQETSTTTNAQQFATLSHIILASTAAFLVFIIVLSYIDATKCRINDFYKLSCLINAAIHTLDMLSDILFTAQLSFHLQINEPSPLFLIFVTSILFIIIPILITLAQLNHEINKHWIKNDQLNSWISKNVKILYCLSILLGSSFASVDVCCSHLFQMDVFSLPIARKRLIGFQNKIYSLVLCENVPQLALQILYAYVYKPELTWRDEIVYISMAFSVISIIAALFSWKSRKNVLDSQDYVSIQFDVKGHAVCSNITKCKKRVNQIKECLSGVLGIEKSLIEITKPSQIPHGLLIKINIFVNYVKAVDTNWKGILNDAAHSGQVGQIFKESWNLSTSPSITNIQYKINQRKNTIYIKVISPKPNNKLLFDQNIKKKPLKSLIPFIKKDYGTSHETKQEQCLSLPLMPIIKNDYVTNDETKQETDSFSSIDSVQNTTQTKLDENPLLYEKNWTLLMDAIEQNCLLAQQYGVFKAMRSVTDNLLEDDEKYRTLYV